MVSKNCTFQRVTPQQPVFIISLYQEKKKKSTFSPAVALCSPNLEFSSSPSQLYLGIKFWKTLEAWDLNLPYAPVQIRNHIRAPLETLHVEHGKCCKVVAAAKSSSVDCPSSVVIPHKSVRALLILNKVFNWNINALSPHFRRFKPCFWLFFSQSCCDLLWRFSIYSFLFIMPQEKEASLWFGVETAQHKGKTAFFFPSEFQCHWISWRTKPLY